jgi:capsular polysaccharide transport system ATP-binding protein
VITLTDLTKIYRTHQGPRVVLDKINLQVRKGQKIGILGRNGSGKSTLVRMISGAEYPTSGEVTRTMSVSWPLAFHGGFQGSLSGLDNLRFICRVYNTPFKPIVPFVEEFSELGRYLWEPVKTYSSGMLARLAFALSMAVEFDCFLIDEVVAVGDQRFHEKCHEELFGKRGDRAMIIISHNPAYIRAHCQTAAVMVRGRLHEFADVDQAFKFYQLHAAEQDT